MFLVSKHGAEATDKLFKDMEDIVICSLFSVQRAMINDKHCFELYGYDMLFDENLKPWLIEVNASPSVSIFHNLCCGIAPSLFRAAHCEHA